MDMKMSSTFYLQPNNSWTHTILLAYRSWCHVIFCAHRFVNKTIKNEPLAENLVHYPFDEKNR